MQDPDVEVALTSEPQVVPSADFSQRVMTAVRRDVAEQQGMPFPWRILLPGVGISAAVILAAILAPAGGTLSASTLNETGGFSDVVAWLSLTGVGSFVIVWWSLRLESRP
jgi:hypothetical protein